jgi:hypothetical protein
MACGDRGARLGKTVFSRDAVHLPQALEFQSKWSKEKVGFRFFEHKGLGSSSISVQLAGSRAQGGR